MPELSKKFLLYRYAVPALCALLFAAFPSGNSLAQSARAQEITGKVIKSIADDLKNNRAKTEFHLKDDATGEMIQLRFQEGKIPNWVETGKTVKVRGKQGTDSSLDVEAINFTEDSTLSSDSNLAPAAGGRTIAIIPLNFNDGTAHMGNDAIVSMMWGSSNSVNDLYKEATFGKITFEPDANGDGQPDILGPVHLDLNGSGSCDYSHWSLKAHLALEAQGIDLSIYDHYMFILPSNVGCWWSGLAELSGFNSYLKGGGASVAAHELGHNLGLNHASTDPEDDGTRNSEYGDHSCPMGSANLSFFNSFNALRLGTFDGFNGTLIDNPRAGTYDLHAMTTHPSSAGGAQIIRILKAPAQEYEPAKYYYLSFRQPVNYDSALSSTYTRGVSIHYNSYYRGLFVRSIAPGESYTLSNGTVITADLISSDGSFIRVNINKETTTCTGNTPSLSISPSNVSVAPTGSTSLDVTVTNNDSSDCLSTSFDLTPTLPAGVSGSLSASSVNVAPGQSQTVSLNLSFTDLASDQTIQVSAADSDGVSPDHSSVTASATLDVQAPDDTAPTVPTGLTAQVDKHGRVNLSYNASTDAGSGVSHYNIYRDSGTGMSLVGTSSSTNFTDSPAIGSYTYAVSAVDAAGNESGLSSTATANVTSTKGNGNGNGGGKDKPGGGKGNGKGPNK